MEKAILFIALLAVFAALPVAAADRSIDSGTAMENPGMDEGGTMHGRMLAQTDTGATGQGTIDTVDADKGVVTIAHGPIPALGWPAMTMDLPVAEGVDLGAVQPGERVRFRVALGADQVYRITAIDPAP